MKEERAYNTTLDKIFADLIAELEKQPVSRKKALELENQFLNTLHNAYGIGIKIDDLSSTSEQANQKIVLDMTVLSKRSSKYALNSIQENASKLALILVLIFVGILFITVGFLLIITPASAEFEIATLFYFNENDGFTVMDLIALSIVFIGIFFFLRAFVATDKKD